MVIGNKQAQHILATYFSHISEHDDISFPFLLVAGPSQVGKTTIIEQHVEELLGEYMVHDYLPLYDLSDTLNKKHSLKVHVDEKKQFVTLDEKVYRDYGTRDVVNWLAMSPTGTYKIVFLENIDRMSGAAANALLKTLEEPLPGRLIIATTSNIHGILDTIVSRAYIIDFQLPAPGEVKEYTDTRYTDKKESERLFATSLSLGRIGLIKQLLDTADSEDIVQMSQDFAALLAYFRHGEGSLVTMYKLLQAMVEKLGHNSVYDALIYALDQYQDTAIHHLLEKRSLFDSNVNKDHVLFSTLLMKQ